MYRRILNSHYVILDSLGQRRDRNRLRTKCHINTDFQEGLESVDASLNMNELPIAQDMATADAGLR